VDNKVTHSSLSLIAIPDGPRLLVDAEVDKKHISILIDTGASISVGRFCPEYSKLKHRDRPLPVKYANGEVESLVKQTHVRIILDGNIYWHWVYLSDNHYKKGLSIWSCFLFNMERIFFLFNLEGNLVQNGRGSRASKWKPIFASIWNRFSSPRSKLNPLLQNGRFFMDSIHF